MNSMAPLWSEKHRPKKVSEVLGNSSAVQKFVDWIDKWPAKKKVALLHGPAGVGKTSTVLAYAAEKDYDLVEVNASDWRNKERIESVVGHASSQVSIIKLEKIVLVDEVDGIAGREDHGGLAALTKLISRTRVPIVLVANTPWDQRFATLRNSCELIQFMRIRQPTVVSYLKQICEREGVEIRDEILKAISEKADGDLRSAINDLQLASRGFTQPSLGDLESLAKRDRIRNVFEGLSEIFGGRSLFSAKRAAENLDVDLDTFFVWILDNVPNQFTDPEELTKAMDALARADVYMRRIQRTRKWVFLRYAIPFMTGGVYLAARSRARRHGRFSYPDKLRFMSRTRNVRTLLKGINEKIGGRCHMSMRKANLEMLPFLKLILSKPRFGQEITHFFTLTEDEVKLLTSRTAKVVAG